MLRTFPENHVAFQVFFGESTFHSHFNFLIVRQTSHQDPSQKTMLAIRFCFTFPENHVGVSIVCCASTAFQVFLCVKLRTKNLSRKPCGVSSFFFCVDLRNKNLPRKPCGTQFFFVRRPSIFKFLCVSNFTCRTFQESHVTLQVFFASRPLHQEPSQIRSFL